MADKKNSLGTEEKNKFSWRKRAQSFAYAFAGLKKFIHAEHNMWIHFAATILVIAAGCWKSLNRYEWMAVIFAIGIVWIAEAVNTCIEKMMNLLAPQTDERVKYIKDLSAGAVLVAAIMAAAIGCIVFWPKFF